MQKNIRALAGQFINQNHISHLPITFETLEEIAKNRNITLYSYIQGQSFIDRYNLYQTIKNYDAFAFTLRDIVIIFYRDDLSYSDKLFALTHELGHIFLRHPAYDRILGRSRFPKEQAMQETEADNFAYHVLGCPSLLKSRHINSISDLSAHTLLEGRHAEICYAYFKDATYKRFFPHFFTTIPGRITCASVVLLFAAFILYSIPPISGLFSATNSASGLTKDSASAPVPTQVYITPSGAKYHLEGCVHIGNRETLPAMTQQEAEANGYTLCLSCKKVLDQLSLFGD